MRKRSTLIRRIALSFVAVQLALGGVSGAALIGAAPAVAETLREHGAWQGFTSSVDGKTVFGVLTKMSKGGTAAFMAKDGTLSMILTDPTWRLEDGRALKIRVTIDGTTYDGTAIVRGRDLIEIPDVYTNMIKQFADGAQAVVDVDGGDIVWTLDLDGFTASMDEAVRTYRNAI